MAGVGITPDQFSPAGNAQQGQFYTSRFPVSTLFAARVAKDAYDNLRDESGKWKVINAKLVTGRLEKLNIGNDENSRTRLSRRMARAFIQAMGGSHVEVEQVHFRPGRETVFVDPLPIL